MLAIKVLFRKSDGRLLGAQVLGEDGVPKRIDSFAMAIQMGCTIYDLEEAELCYAPPFGSAQGSGQLRGDGRGEYPSRRHAAVPLELCGRRFPSRCAESCRNLPWSPLPGALNIPLPQLRARSGELPETARSSSFAAPRSAPTTRRASFCRTDSKPEISPAACCHARMLRRLSELKQRKAEYLEPIPEVPSPSGRGLG